MHSATRAASILLLAFAPLLTACNDNDHLEDDVDALKAQVAALQAAHDAHVADLAIHHPKTTSFSELTDTISDAQVPDDITILFAEDSHKLDGFHAHEIAESGAFTPSVFAPPFWEPVGTFSYLRTGTRVRVTGTVQIALPDFHQIFPLDIDVGNLPYRTAAFAAATDAIGTCETALTHHGAPSPVTCDLAALSGSASVRLHLESVDIPGDGTVSMDFSYDVDP
jgi:hypothetical protein